ncbi:3-dehydroquinate synthase [Thioalkalivibrio sp. K90mix]|uniref:3-dehydroquinate synthase n=1 Tax=unclassified Thioalkalivibrio TaxID=2621013 RepID=UPI000195AAD3|nr:MULTISPECIES: 3-dehydroquinate synthase [unclassified Thioalkalivibrio]ADC70783.1 3-dehydroquinate synthase [Thioalkalivibrio sp. K90mix]
MMPLMNAPGTQNLNVELGERSYPIRIGPGQLAAADTLRPALEGRRVAVVTNTTVGPLYGEALRETLEQCGIAGELLWIELPDGEAHKTLATVESIITRLLEARLDRGSRIVALGGGVVGDIAGFAAAIYQRGIDFVQIPTTLLAQVDSSVGGKTGVNHPLGKNMIGAFHQPRAVLIDTDTLKTLPERELQAGLAEVIKYGLIRDADFFAWLEAHIDELRALEPKTLAYAIHRSCACKAEIVAADEREGGIRALLNLGHTFGHAIEAGMGYGQWLHGEAVGTGMAMAARMSERMGWLSRAERERAEALIQRAGLALEPPDTMTAERFRELMAIDKKVSSGRLRLVLLRAIGQAELTDQFDVSALDATLHEGARVA